MQFCRFKTTLKNTFLIVGLTLLLISCGGSSGSITERLLGDTNADGIVDNSDAAHLARSLSGSERLDCPPAADANMDGVIDLDDVATIETIATDDSIISPTISTDCVLSDAEIVLNQRSLNIIKEMGSADSCSVQLTSPAHNSTVSGILDARANAGGAEIEKVNFRLISPLNINIGWDFGAPYQAHIPTDNIPDDIYQLRAKAYAFNGTTCQDIISVTIDNGNGGGGTPTPTPTPPPGEDPGHDGPAIITEPAAGSTVSGAVDIRVYAPADTYKVEYEAEGPGGVSELGTDFSPPWNKRFYTSHYPDGGYQLRIRAYTDSMIYFDSIDVIVNNGNGGGTPPTPTPTPPPGGDDGGTGQGFEFPEQNEFNEAGVVLRNGPEGSWDVRLSGAISPSNVIKKDGRYFLYYVGASGDRTTDGGPAFRKLGVATSLDGINYTKYNGNPILEFTPNDSQEEAVFSIGATLDSNNRVLVHYTACAAYTPHLVNCDIRAATSNDGYNFTDRGIVLDHRDGGIWGGGQNGDEFFALGTYLSPNGTWYHYYTATNSQINRKLGVAWGSSYRDLPNSRGYIVSGSQQTKGNCDPFEISNDTMAMFVEREGGRIEARTFSKSRPDQLSEAVKTYTYSNQAHTTVFHDQSSNRLLMYYMPENREEIRLRIAGTH